LALKTGSNLEASPRVPLFQTDTRQISTMAAFFYDVAGDGQGFLINTRLDEPNPACRSFLNWASEMELSRLKAVALEISGLAEIIPPETPPPQELMLDLTLPRKLLAVRPPGRFSRKFVDVVFSATLADCDRMTDDSYLIDKVRVADHPSRVAVLVRTTDRQGAG
jgi:hypothetical protein